MRIFPKIALLVAMLIVASTTSGGALAQSSQLLDVSLLSGGKLWIDGSSTVNSWTCEADDLSGEARIPSGVNAEEGVRSGGQATRSTVRLSARVEAFECGRDRMDRDFYDALKAERHPEIVFELVDARVVDAPASEDGWYRLLVRGNLSIAGTTRAVETSVEGRRIDGDRFRVRGSKPLTMSSFGIKPPVALLGLVKAHDDIEVHFDLIATESPLAHGR